MIFNCDATHKDIWNNYIARQEHGTFYHRFEWPEIIQQTYGYAPIYLAQKKEDKISGILPFIKIENSFVSLPFLNYGGILADSAKDEAELLAEAKKIALNKKINSVEIRQAAPLLSRPDDLFVDKNNVSMILDLPASEQALWNQFNNKVRNQIRKGQKADLKITIGHDTNIFYQIYSQNMRDLGTPQHHINFFKNILIAFPEETSILTVWQNTNPIASIFLIRNHQTLYGPWAGSDKKYLSLCPNNFLYWKTFKFAILNQCQYFDFERSQRGSGAYAFKSQWGAKEHQLFYYYFHKHHKKNLAISDKKKKYKIFSQIWRYLPLGLTRLIGPKIRKYIP